MNQAGESVDLLACEVPDEEKDRLSELLGKLVGFGGPEIDLGPEPDEFED